MFMVYVTSEMLADLPSWNLLEWGIMETTELQNPCSEYVKVIT